MSFKLDYRTKIGLVIVAAFVVSYGVNATVVKSELEAQATTMLQEKARAITQEAENARQYVADLRGKHNAFDDKTLLAEVAEKMEGATDRLAAAKETSYYWTIPIVAGWKVGEQYAEAAGYTFRVPKIEPRNPANEPTPIEREMLLALRQSGDRELVRIDREANVLRYMKPVLLSDDCMVCHGTIEDSITGTMKDPLGFDMEGWKSGEMHGGFEVVASLEPVQAAVAATLKKNIMWGLLLVPLSILVIMMAFRRFVVKPMNEVAEGVLRVSQEVSMEAEGLARGNTDLAHRTEEQASSLEETAASMEQITATIKQTAENAVQANDLAEDTADGAIAGNEMVQQTVAAMAEITESSKKISEIIGVIDNIAFQTNLLALNAAVEAARAGDAGSGFAVVAEEVRNLAQRSAESAQEIKELIEDSTHKVAVGNELVAKTGEALADVVNRVEQVTTLVGDISNAAQEQAQGVHEVNTAISHMDEVTQQNAAVVEEASASAEHLAKDARKLGEMMAAFNVGGAHAHTAPALPSGGFVGKAKKSAPPAKKAAAGAPPANKEYDFDLDMDDF